VATFLAEVKSLVAYPYHWVCIPAAVYFWANPQLTQIGLRAGLSGGGPFSGPVLPVTIACAIGLVATVVLLSQRKVGPIRSIFYALTLCAGALGMYELGFEVIFPNTVYTFKLGMFLLVVAGLCSVEHWRFTPPLAAIWLAWFSTLLIWGLVDPTIPRSSTWSFALLMNGVSKAAAFVAFSAPYLLGLRVRDPPGHF
jgi:hypothetical protein